MTEFVQVKNFINGEFTDCVGMLDSFNPATGEIWAKIPDSGQNEVDAAVNAATHAFPRWSQTPQAKRSAILQKVADILESRLDEFAVAESRDQGKPVSLAKRMDIPRAVHNMRFFATSCLNHQEKANYMDIPGALNYTTRLPVGVAGLISPWNLPLYLLTFKLGPALASGNTVVCKPSEMTSVTAWMFCEVLSEAGVPPGVVNMVFGTGPKAGDALVRHPSVPLISFTGGTATASVIRAATATQCKKLSLELGGKNPGIIFEDADLEKCIPTTIRSSFVNQGEVCLCISRVFVQRSIYDRFLEKFIAEARAIKVGDPSAPDTGMGALVSKEHAAKVIGYIKRAAEGGATIQCGHGVDKGVDGSNGFHPKGYFVRPTIITNVKDNDAIMQEEVFGPVVCVVPFDNEEEVVRRANGVQYGLCATVWTSDASRLHRVARKLEAGTVWANCWLLRDLHMPFGGCKSSGVGRDGAVDSTEFYTEVKTVCVQIE
ncbi:hypothetical protein CAPTEDRAFT_228352 [Capitella teleta]|uniref:Aldehyde dehydrogenase domain-containing protein n=1 Tax=Capitella teleta TaxID=283909 RepID=R7VF34_CAPTE|nr:hypothetical protein CAPTEDRAFT_228352 [Capitella teleta]|eukprot:ELU17473.1 hypothetical protein CAPTEDRAFT_228352 [Capitella teleta]